jgi:hypothetical protein
MVVQAKLNRETIMAGLDPAILGNRQRDSRVEPANDAEG